MIIHIILQKKKNRRRKKGKKIDAINVSKSVSCFLLRGTKKELQNQKKLQKEDSFMTKIIYV